MTLFTLRLVARSKRWVAPTTVYVVWLVLVLANPGPALSNAANMFFAAVVFAAWLAVATGNVDDDPHRDLCAAAAGSPARLHIDRALATMAASTGVAVVTASLTASTGDLGPHTLFYAVACTLALLITGALIGSAIGIWLHRPLIRNTAWSLILAVSATITVALLQPVQDVLRNFNHQSTHGVFILLVAAATSAALATIVSAQLAYQRS
jgi:hypothetical protein